MQNGRSLPHNLAIVDGDDEQMRWVGQMRRQPLDANGFVEYLGRDLLKPRFVTGGNAANIYGHVDAPVVLRRSFSFAAPFSHSG